MLKSSRLQSLAMHQAPVAVCKGHWVLQSSLVRLSNQHNTTLLRPLPTPPPCLHAVCDILLAVLQSA